MVPFERAMVVYYWFSIVTTALSLTKERWWFTIGSPLWPLHSIVTTALSLTKERRWFTIGSPLWPLHCL